MQEERWGGCERAVSDEEWTLRLWRKCAKERDSSSLTKVHENVVALTIRFLIVVVQWYPTIEIGRIEAG